LSNLASSLPLFEYLGVEIIQSAADSALGPGVLTFSDDATGLSMGLTLQSGQVINISGVGVGTQGLSGRLTVNGLNSATPLTATLFDGFTIGLTAFDVTLSNGGITQSQIVGQFQVPFFTDGGKPKTVDVELGFDAQGGFSVALATTQSVNPITPDGLVQLQYSIGDQTTIEIDVASFEVDPSRGRIVISGRLLLTTADLQWPAFELRGLGIDTKGNISIDGGWIDLPNQTGLDFYGFHIALQKLGLGSDDSGRWIGFNGDIHLVEGLTLAGSLRGLRVNLENGSVSLDGVGIDFSVSGVLSITGEVDHIHVDAYKPQDLTDAGLLPTLFDQIQNPSGQPSLPKKVDVFTGKVDVAIDAVPGLEFDGKFIVGHFGGMSVFFLDLDVDLPAGIPIFLDVSLYGLEGLIASNLDPQPEPNNTWWEWYKYPTDKTGIDTSATPDYDATDVNKWLVPKQGALALGAGATIGTSVDDGFTVSAAITLILKIPGPVLMLIGKANILSKRISSPSQDASFDAMAVYDGNSQTFDITVDAHYQIPAVFEVDGTAELHVSTTDQPSWFFALGLPPHEKRLKARIFDLFETDSYFVVGDFGLITGTWTGYRAAYDFGPLSVSLDAYLATLAAVVWSPLQIGGGIELHGDIHLEAFGIGLGITADALLEGCAPNPFYVHGELSVELGLPFPLGSIGATISLTWGGDDGSTPPPPLALNHVDVTLIDHTDNIDQPTSDHYVLLAHRAGGAGVWPDITVQYDDPQKPGILKLDPTDKSWQGRIDSFTDFRKILPDFDPSNLDGRYAPAVPQDAHLVLTFAHPTLDLAGFENASSPPAENPVPSLPNPPVLPADDMSNINPNPPSVQFQYQHSLLQVAIFEYTNGAWQFVCAMPQTTQEKNNPPEGLTWLAGAWQAPPPPPNPSVTPDPQQQQTQLKIFPYSMLPGEQKSASWVASGASETIGTQFIDQDLAFQFNAGFPPATIGEVIPAAVAAGATQPGLAVDWSGGGSGEGLVHITFPTSIQLLSIAAVLLTRGEGGDYSSSAPMWSGDGTQFSWLAPLGGGPPPIYPPPTEGPGSGWTQTFPAITPNIRQLTTFLGAPNILILYAIDYQLPPVKMGILPDAPALYAIQTVTSIKAGRVNSGPVDFGSVTALPPIVEFAYLQTVSGPGAATLSAASPSPPGFQAALYPSVNGSPSPPPPPGSTPSPPSTFPLGGALKDLQTYAQWTWPENGAPAAYYGYDLNVEFVETYVNALYAAFPTDGVQNYLHFRCVDRNQRFTALQPIAIHVSSIYPANALVAQAVSPQIPAVVAAAAAEAPLPVTPEALAVLAQRAKLAPQIRAIPGLDALPQGLSAAANRLSTRIGASFAAQVTPNAAADILLLLQEEADAASVRSLWFQPFAPQTHYTLDVVVGPFVGEERTAPSGSLAAIYSAADASGALSALQAYYAYENSLPTLLRVQFTTSRYATFADQMVNVTLQLSNSSEASTPIRHYVAAVDPNTWLADPSHLNLGRLASKSSNPPGPYSVYLDTRTDLANAVATLVSNLLDFDGKAPYVGAATLAPKRQAVADAWSNFSSATSTVFDGLIAALGRPDLVSNSISPSTAPLPDTELTFFTDSSFKQVFALLLECPVPMPWRRIWRWVQLTADGGVSSVVDEKNVFWSADGTRGLLVVQGQPLGNYELTIAFQGNIGAEAPCITSNGNGVWDMANLGQIDFQGPIIRRPPPRSR
jgi:hypothetical protein